MENNQIILQNGNLKFHVNMTGPELPKYVLSCLRAIQKEIQACTNVPLDVYIKNVQIVLISLYVFHLLFLALRLDKTTEFQ